MEQIMKKKVLIISVICILIIITITIGILVKNSINKKEIENSIHGVVIADKVPFYSKPKTDNVKQIKLLEKSENVYILDKIKENGIEWYKVKINNKNGYVMTENVEYYKEVNKEKLLTVDVSKFDMEKNFKTVDDFKVFLLDNKISYVYIRAGGRGYGKEGKFYEDEYCKQYIDICEYLKVPYGLYFLDEAINSKEIDEEVKFIKNFLNKNAGKNCVLPVALDIEKHESKGRTDDIWNERAKLVQELIDDLEKEKIPTIVYTNARNS